MLYNNPVRFGALLIEENQFEKLKSSPQLGNPKFTVPHSAIDHARANARIAGALSSALDRDVFVGGYWSAQKKEGKPPATIKNAVIFQTKADGQPGEIGRLKTGEPLPPYNPSHPDEMAIK